MIQQHALGLRRPVGLAIRLGLLIAGCTAVLGLTGGTAHAAETRPPLGGVVEAASGALHGAGAPARAVTTQRPARRVTTHVKQASAPVHRAAKRASASTRHAVAHTTAGPRKQAAKLVGSAAPAARPVASHPVRSLLQLAAGVTKPVVGNLPPANVLQSGPSLLAPFEHALGATARDAIVTTGPAAQASGPVGTTPGPALGAPVPTLSSGPAPARQPAPSGVPSPWGLPLGSAGAAGDGGNGMTLFGVLGIAAVLALLRPGGRGRDRHDPVAWRTYRPLAQPG